MTSYRLTRPSWAVPGTAFVLLFFVAPLVANIGRGSQTEAYVKLLTNSYYGGVFWRTMEISVISTLACLVAGYPIAYFIVRLAGRWSGAMVFIVIAPLLTSIIMRTFGWRVILSRRGLWNGALDWLGLLGRPVNWADEPIAVYLGLVHVLVPFMVLSIAPVLQGVDVRLEESARVLGAGKAAHLPARDLAAQRRGGGDGLPAVLRDLQRQLPDHAAAGRRQDDDDRAADLPAVQRGAGCRLRGGAGQRADAGGGDLLCAAIRHAAPPGRVMRWVLYAYVAVFVLFIVLPIAAVVLVSFSSASFIVFPMTGFSFRWYRHIVEYRPFIDSLIVSVELAFASAICSAALGVPAALALARSRNPAAGALVNLLIAPVSVPAIVLGFALLYFLAGLGLGLSFVSLLIAHSVAGMPYVVRTVLATYRGVAASLEEAASILGANRWQVLRHVTLPMVRPGIFAGATFAVLTSLDNLPLSYFFGSASTNTLPVVMLSYMENQFDPSIAAISAVQLLIALLALILLDRIYGVERLTVA